MVETVCGVLLSIRKPEESLGEAMEALGITQALCPTFDEAQTYPAPIIQTLKYRHHLTLGGTDLEEPNLSAHADDLCAIVRFAPRDRVIFDEVPTALAQTVRERTQTISGIRFYHVIRADGIFQEIREGLPT